MKLRKGDTVKITIGKDKGKEGKIEALYPAKNKNGLSAKADKVLVPSINIYKKHVKAQLTVDGKGGIFEFSRPLDVSKVALICPNCKKQTRVGYKMVDGKKERICKKCKKQI